MKGLRVSPAGERALDPADRTCLLRLLRVVYQGKKRLRKFLRSKRDPVNRRCFNVLM